MSEGYPVQPYGYKSNPNSILDVADIVFINPVNTGYSRMLENDGKKVDGKTIFWNQRRHCLFGRVAQYFCKSKSSDGSLLNI